MCNFCNKQFDSISDLDLHKSIECDNIMISCQLKDYGCSEPFMRGQLATHYLTEQHQNTMIALVDGHFSKPMNDRDTTDGNMNMDTGYAITTTMVSSTDENSSSPLEDMYKTVHILTGGIQALNDDNQRLNNQMLHVQIQGEDLHKGISTLKSSIEEEDIFLHALKSNHDILSQDVASLEQNVDDLRSVSYDGTLIWKITSVREKMSKSSIFPIFFSTKTII